MQPGFCAIREAHDDIKHIGTGRRQRLVETGKRGCVVVGGHMAGGRRLPEHCGKAGGFPKQRCDCRHADPPAAADAEGPPSKSRLLAACNLAHIGDAVFGREIRAGVRRLFLVLAQTLKTI